MTQRKPNQVPTATDLTASRALNTTYTNTNQYSVLVLITLRCAITVAAGSAYAQAKSDSASPPTTLASGVVGIESGLLNEDNTFQLSFLAEAGKNYRVDSTVANGTVTLGKWMEVAL